LLSDLLKNNGINALIESTHPEVNSTIKPDIYIKNDRDRKLHIIDLKSPYDNLHGTREAKRLNVEKYTPLAIDLARYHKYKYKVDTIVVCSLGSWDPNNEIVLSNLGIPRSCITKFAVDATRGL
jgi:hypothetical protein